MLYQRKTLSRFFRPLNLLNRICRQRKTCSRFVWAKRSYKTQSRLQNYKIGGGKIVPAPTSIPATFLRVTVNLWVHAWPLSLNWKNLPPHLTSLLHIKLRKCVVRFRSAKQTPVAVPRLYSGRYGAGKNLFPFCLSEAKLQNAIPPSKL